MTFTRFFYPFCSRTSGAVLEVAVGDYDVDLSRVINAAEKKYCEERAQYIVLGCDSNGDGGGKQMMAFGECLRAPDSGFIFQQLVFFALFLCSFIRE